VGGGIGFAVIDYCRWPPPWQPVSVDWVSPFFGYVVGSVLGFVGGICWLKIRKRKSSANNPVSENGGQSLPVRE